MDTRLPDSIATFFHISNNSHVPLPRHCFTQDAVVRDEGRTYLGYDAIQAWLLETQLKYAYSTEPMSAVDDRVALHVQVKLAGNFPGSPLQLIYSFTLINSQIFSLEIRS